MNAQRPYQPKIGQRCHCKPGQHRDNCPECEGTGWRIDFAAIRAATAHLRTARSGVPSTPAATSTPNATRTL